MTTLIILIILSIDIIYFGLKFIKVIYEDVNNMFARGSFQRSKPTMIHIIYFFVSAFLGIIGAVLYYWVIVATITDIVIPRYPVEEPLPYGISLIIVSLIFAGGWATFMIVVKNVNDSLFYKKLLVNICMIAFIVLLVVYLPLKSMMILP